MRHENKERRRRALSKSVRTGDLGEESDEGALPLGPWAPGRGGAGTTGPRAPHGIELAHVVGDHHPRLARGAGPAHVRTIQYNRREALHARATRVTHSRTTHARRHAALERSPDMRSGSLALSRVRSRAHPTSTIKVDLI